MNTEKNPKQIVASLAKILKLKKWPSYELARIIGCPDSTLSRWLNGATQPSKAWQKLIEGNEKVWELLKDAEKGA